MRKPRILYNLSMYYDLKALFVGFATGYLSGQFGLGGGLIATPGLRLVLKTSAAIALGTTLPIALPSAISGSLNYARRRLVDWKLATYLIPPGLFGVLAGAILTAFVPTDLLLLLTAIIIFFLGLPYLVSKRTGPLRAKPATEAPIAIAIGAAAGFLGGLLGLGGGFLLIPGMTGLLGKPLKEAFGTSLVAVAALAIPGTLVHYYLGHINLAVMALLVMGSMPGAYVGSRVAIAMNEKLLRTLFGAFLMAVAVYFAVFELRVLFGGGR